jgi:MOSC domain-containing protein YiiM
MQVVAVASSPSHSFSKAGRACIRLLKGLGVEGDAHAGSTVKHRSRVKQDPTQPNLRQVHLLHAELHAELSQRGFQVAPGAMGENILTEGIALLALPAGTKLAIGESAVVEVTGLRNPCRQIDAFMPGLLSAVLDRTPSGELVRKAGIMAVVLNDGEVRPGDRIRIEYPPEPHKRLERV